MFNIQRARAHPTQQLIEHRTDVKCNDPMAIVTSKTGEQILFGLFPCCNHAHEWKSNQFSLLFDWNIYRIQNPFDLLI